MHGPGSSSGSSLLLQPMKQAHRQGNDLRRRPGLRGVELAHAPRSLHTAHLLAQGRTQHRGGGGRERRTPSEEGESGAAAGQHEICGRLTAVLFVSVPSCCWAPPLEQKCRRSSNS